MGLDKNVPACFQLVEWKAVQSLWTTFLNGDHHDFIMDKNELQKLFETWQTEGRKKKEMVKKRQRLHGLIMDQMVKKELLLKIYKISYNIMLKKLQILFIQKKKKNMRRGRT